MCRSGSPKTKPLSTTFENNNPFLECDCPPPSTDNNKPMIKWTRRKGLTSSSSESRNLASSASESSDWSDIIVDSEESSVSVANSRSGNKGLLEAAVLDSVFRKRSLSSSQVSLFNITVSDPNMNLLIKKWPADFRLTSKKRWLKIIKKEEGGKRRKKKEKKKRREVQTKGGQCKRGKDNHESCSTICEQMMTRSIVVRLCFLYTCHTK